VQPLGGGRGGGGDGAGGLGGEGGGGIGGGGEGLVGATWATVLTIGAEAMLSPVKFEARASEASAVDTEAWVAAAALAPATAIRTVRIAEALLTSTSTAEASTPASVAKRLARSAS
jgi:hypothetical protein